MSLVKTYLGRRISVSFIFPIVVERQALGLVWGNWGTNSISNYHTTEGTRSLNLTPDPYLLLPIMITSNLAVLSI